MISDEIEIFSVIVFSSSPISLGLVEEESLMSEKRCYTVKELQEILQISRPAIYDLLKRKEFSWVVVGGKYRISKKSFDEWLDHVSEG